jgi:hypothetical protein
MNRENMNLLSQNLGEGLENTPSPSAVGEKVLNFGSDITIGGFLNLLLEGLFYLAVGVCIIFILVSGFKYFTAQKEDLEEGQKTLTTAITALVILLLLRFIVGWIFDILGITLDLSVIGG